MRARHRPRNVGQSVLTRILAVARRSWWVLLLAGCIGGLEGYLFGPSVSPGYEARSQLLVGPINADIDTLRAATELAQTYAQLATSRPLLTAASRQLRLVAPPGFLAKNVAASANSVTRVLTIRARARDGRIAARIANALAAQLVALSKRGTSAPVAGQVQVIAAAQPPGTQVGLPKVSVVLGSVLGGVVAMLTILLVFQRFDANVRGSDDLADLAPVAYLGSVNGSRGVGRRGPLVVASRPESSAAAAYRFLAAKIQSHEGGLAWATLLVIGVHDAFGTGEVAANLSLALAGGDRRVTLVDALPDGEITHLLRLERRPGVAEYLSGDATALNRVPHAPGLDILPRGETGDEEALEPHAARTVLERLLQGTDLLVLNAPPLNRSPTTLAWARVADATLLVVRRGTTRREAVSEAVRTLDFVGANLIGTILSER